MKPPPTAKPTPGTVQPKTASVAQGLSEPQRAFARVVGQALAAAWQRAAAQAADKPTDASAATRPAP